MARRKLIIALISLSFFLLSPLALASNGIELKLWKKDQFSYGPCGHCGDFERFVGNRDRGDFSEFDLYLASGYYTVDLSGPAGTTVTLFADKDFKMDRGYLIITKKDDAQITISDIENFPAEKWVEGQGEEDGMGKFTAFYVPHQNFKNNVASVKWGKWWSASSLPQGSLK
ncbi:MAG: hypothetical protein ACE5EK_07245 [Nitrospinales bacterium]